MSRQPDLSTLRAELKLKLADGTYDPMMERIIKLARRMFRLPQNDLAPFLVLTAAYLCIVSLLFSLDGGKFLKERILVLIPGAFFVCLGVILYARLFRQLYRALSGYVINSMTQPADFGNLSRWLSLFSNPLLTLVLVVASLPLMTSYVAAGLAASYGHFGASGLAGLAVGSFIMIIILHHVWTLMFFPVILSQYHIDLYELDPGSSPSIREISLVIRDSAYSLSVYATTFTLYIFYMMGANIFPLAYFYLSPVLGIFIFRQIGLSLIVGRARWTTLERLSANMEKLDVEQHFDNPAIHNQYKAMLDYYNRVKNAESGVFDARTGTLLFTSFLLPLIAFVLFQFDKIVAFIDRFIH